MSRHALVVALPLLAALVAAGCARVQAPPDPPEPRVESRLHSAIAALERSDYSTARAELAWLHSHNHTEPAGRQASLLLAAIALDPRNPDGHPNQAAAVAAGDFGTAAPGGWSRLLSEVLYLVALDLGAEPMPEEAAGDGESASSKARLPSLPRPTLAARLRELQDEREQLGRRIARLEQDLLRKDQEIARKDQELERIRRTLRP